MKRKTKAPPLIPAVLGLVKVVVNKTAEGDVGYAEAASMVSEVWDQFDAAGATVGDMDAIMGQVRWMKWEGFCEADPVS
jgi:hypothetical protein